MLNIRHCILGVYATTILLATIATAGAEPDYVKNIHQKLYLELFTTGNGNERRNLDNNQFLQSDSNSYDLKITHASKGCARGTFFYSFSEDCQKSMLTIEELLLAQQNTSDLIALARELKVHPNLHPKVWYNALTAVTLQRQDLRGLWKPSPLDIIPDAFVNALAFEEAQSQSQRGVDEKCFILDEKFGEDNLKENLLWYFREDVQVNSQHWFWHLSYPTRPPKGTIRGDRRGELFFYFHRNILQRYTAERLAHGSRVVTMEEGYNPHLSDSLSQGYWDSRPPFSRIPESIRDGRLTLNESLIWRSRILKSIDQGMFTYPNRTESIKPSNGNDALSDLTEASDYSLNRPYYGNFHNTMHNMIAAVNDPTMTVTIGVMADSAVSLRDPIFYRWHNNIDEIYERYQRTLPPYQLSTGDFPLLWDGVQLSAIEVFPTSRPANGTLQTFWSVKPLTLTRRLDISVTTQPAITICAKHLNHEDFGYHLVVNLDPAVHSSSRNATVRIFMAPRFSENEQRFSFEEQRTLFFAMDLFKTTIKPGVNVIMRYASESTLTSPWEQSLSNLEGTAPPNRPLCGCGWPDHMLLPKGTAEGMEFDLFAMVTNGDQDKVNPEESDDGEDSSCRSAPLLCGILGKKYPDARPMGYPLDRKAFQVIQYYDDWTSIIRPVSDLDEYMMWVPNMATSQVKIVHDDTTRN